MTRFGWLDYTIFIGYLAAIVGVGAFFVKEQRTVKDYFLAGRSMSYFIERSRITFSPAAV
jgi:Na+/proline symporter